MGLLSVTHHKNSLKTKTLCVQTSLITTTDKYAPFKTRESPEPLEWHYHAKLYWAWAGLTFAPPPCSITGSGERIDTLSCPDMMDAITPVINQSHCLV